jgi:hypothetical protein
VLPTVTVVLVILLAMLFVVAFLVLASRLYPGSVEELVGLDARRLAEEREAADADDLQQLLELEHRRRPRP